MDICIANHGIILEIIGFALLLPGIRNFFDKKYLGKQLDYKKLISWHWWRNNSHSVGIVLVISGLVCQLSIFNTC